MRYIKDKMGIVGILFIFTIVFTVQFYIEGIALDAIIYGFMINTFILVILGIMDFIKYKNKETKLVRCIDNLPIIDKEDLNNKRYIDELYISIISGLEEILNKVMADALDTKTEMIDFYTLWIHQIKTPIFALKLLVKENENPQIKAEIIKIEQYTNMVLNYIKLSDKTTELSIKTQNIKLVLNDVIKSFSSLFITKRIGLVIDIHNTIVATDEKWLTFAISQILSNALKYTKVGEVRIYLKDSKIVISDTGIGMSEGDVKRAFDKGFTGKIGRSDNNSTGLGLYLCKKSIMLLGFKISLESKIDQGTTVTIDLNQDNRLYD